MRLLTLAVVVLGAAAALCAAAAPAATAAPGDLVWAKSVSGSLGDSFLDVATGPSGAVYAVGVTRGTEEVGKLLLVKYKDAGATATRRWIRSFTWPGRTGSDGVAVRLNAQGDVFVAGSIGISPLSSARGRDVLLLKYDAAGTLQWARKYDGTAHRDDFAVDLVTNAAGGATVLADSHGAGSGEDYVVLKYAANGDRLWTWRYKGPGGADSPAAMAAGPKGSVVVTGSSASRGGGTSAATIRVSAAGRAVWLLRLNSGAGGTTANAVRVVASGSGAGTYLSGSTEGGMSTGRNLLVARLDTADGKRIWANEFDENGGDDAAVAMAVDDAGNTVSAGSETDRATGVEHARVTRVSAVGNELWSRAVFPGAATTQSGFNSVVLDAAGNAYLGGWWDRGTGDQLDFLVAGVSADNTLRWTFARDGSAHAEDLGRAVTVGAQGVFAAGHLSRPATGLDAQLFKLQK
jgi:hypothetical protein